MFSCAWCLLCCFFQNINTFSLDSTKKKCFNRVLKTPSSHTKRCTHTEPSLYVVLQRWWIIIIIIIIHCRCRCRCRRIYFLHHFSSMCMCLWDCDCKRRASLWECVTFGFTVVVLNICSVLNVLTVLCLVRWKVFLVLLEMSSILQWALSTGQFYFFFVF